jgi:hypothetical protein
VWLFRCYLCFLALTTVLENFVSECAALQPEATAEKFIGWEPLISILVFEGLKLILPELKEWVKLGATVVTMKRQELQKKLVEYARDKELDFPAADKAAEAVASRINQENLGRIVSALEGKAAA